AGRRRPLLVARPPRPARPRSTCRTTRRGYAAVHPSTRSKPWPEYLAPSRADSSARAADSALPLSFSPPVPEARRSRRGLRADRRRRRRRRRLRGGRVRPGADGRRVAHARACDPHARRAAGPSRRLAVAALGLLTLWTA